MAELANFPTVSQLDGSNNAEMDCVPACIAAGLEYLTKKRFTGGEIKDAVYGKNYTGPTAIGAYVGYCNKQGINLVRMPGDGKQIVGAIEKNIEAGYPTLATEPDPYVKPSLGWTHVIIFYGFNGVDNTLTAMDPFIARPVTKKADQWAALLSAGEAWEMKGTHMGGIPRGWSDDGKALHAPGTNHIVVLGFREFILNNYWNPSDIPLENEVHCDPLEISNPALGVGQRQRFRMSTLEYTRARGVFQGWTNQELIAYEQRVKQLTRELADMGKSTK